MAVVGTTAGGIPEAVVPGETGELVEPADPKALAAAIVKLLKDADAAPQPTAKPAARASPNTSASIAWSKARSPCYRRFANQSANSA